MRIAISGASGLIGSTLVRVLRSEDDGRAHQVLRLVRREPKDDDEIGWDPDHGRAPDLNALAGVDAVINLSGVGIGEHRWTPEFKRQILQSRVAPTGLLAETVAKLDPPPRVLLSASAVGYYGDTGDQVVDEQAAPGSDFMAGVCVQWEAAAAPATQAGVRTVLLRSGVVLSTKGGALGRILPLFRAGLGGRLGSGQQYFSWIARPDHIAALRFLLDADLSGPVNVTAPAPVTNAEYTKAVGEAVRRPALFWAPSAALRVGLGGLADTVITGQRVVPHRLSEAGFSFGYPEIGEALQALVAANA